MASGQEAEPLEELSEDRLELPGQPYSLALWNLIIRPPRRRYALERLGPTDFRLWSCRVKRVDINMKSRGLNLRCSHFMVKELAESKPGDGVEPQPVVIYLHQNASCRLEALNLVPLLLPLGMSLFCFDFSGCGESEGEYISLGWFERDDLAACVDYLRKTGKVSAIGLWGRSMGAVTALMHADRDHTIGGMVLDSPFSNLTTLATELAQSEYLAMKVPTWLLSGAMAVGRMRIKSLCGFDIDALTPEQHVGDSFIPAFFVHGRSDDFIAPHHTQKLFEAYNGDKELEIVDGDHNSPRSAALIQKCVLFFVRAFRCSPASRTNPGNLSEVLGLDALSYGSGLGYPVMSRQVLLEAAKHLATARPAGGLGFGQEVWLGERQQAFLPFRVEGALQIAEASAEVGFCICLCPVPSEWGGVSRPPEVLLAYATVAGLRLARATETGPQLLKQTAGVIDPGVPVLCILEMRQRSTTHLRMMLGTGDCALEFNLPEECDQEVYLWLWDSKKGEGMFFDCALTDLPRDRETSPEEETSVPNEFIRVSEGALPPQAGNGGVPPQGPPGSNGNGNGGGTQAQAPYASADARGAQAQRAQADESAWCSQQ